MYIKKNLNSDFDCRSPFIDEFCSCIEKSFQTKSFINIFQDVQEKVSSRVTKVQEWNTPKLLIQIMKIQTSIYPDSNISFKDFTINDVKPFRIILDNQYLSPLPVFLLLFRQYLESWQTPPKTFRQFHQR
jgi:hypothetical protein